MPGLGNQSKKNNGNELSDTYQANRERQQDDKATTDANKKAYKVLAKGTADYLTGGKGGKAADAFFNTKLGDSIANRGAKYLDSIPGMSKATKKLNDSGALDMTDKALSMGEMQNGNGTNEMPNSNSLSSTSGSESISNQVGQNPSFTSMIPNNLGGFDKKESKSILDDNVESDNNGEQQQALEGVGKAFIKKYKFAIIGAFAINCLLE